MSWPQQQGQQQQEQARTAELVKRVQRFIRQTRNAPYRSDTSVVRVAVRLPGLRPQDVYGNGVTGAAWLAEQLAGRRVAAEPLSVAFCPHQHGVMDHACVPCQVKNPTPLATAATHAAVPILQPLRSS